MVHRFFLQSVFKENYVGTHLDLLSTPHSAGGGGWNHRLQITVSGYEQEGPRALLINMHFYVVHRFLCFIFYKRCCCCNISIGESEGLIFLSL